MAGPTAAMETWRQLEGVTSASPHSFTKNATAGRRSARVRRDDAAVLVPQYAGHLRDDGTQERVDVGYEVSWKCIANSSGRSCPGFSVKTRKRGPC